MSTLRYIAIILSAVLFTWIFHEFAHWMAGELTGNDMVMTLNRCYVKGEEYVASWHSTLVTAAGPLATLVQALVVYLLIIKRNAVTLFPYLLTGLYMRAVAGVINFINLNDEGKLSAQLRIGTFTLSAIMVCILFYLTYDAARKVKLQTRSIVIAVVFIMIFSSAIILTDQAFTIVVLP